MATPENTFIASIHRLLPPTLYRQKNHNAYRGGEPDVWYSGVAGDLWVEYKFTLLPRRPDTFVKIDLSELQKNWLRCRHAEGRSVAVIAGCKEGGVYFSGVSWGRPYIAAEFRGLLVSRQNIAAIITGHCQIPEK